MYGIKYATNKKIKVTKFTNKMFFEVFVVFSKLKNLYIFTYEETNSQLAHKRIKDRAKL